MLSTLYRLPRSFMFLCRLRHSCGAITHTYLRYRTIKGITTILFICNSSETGIRHLPLIDSIPYIKDYLQNGHRQAGNPNALLFSVEGGKSFGKGRPLDLSTLSHIYKKFHRELFPKLVKEDQVSNQDSYYY